MPTRSRLRRFAASVLLLWLFGLASGIVNACVVTSGLRHAAHAVALEEAHDHGAHAVAGHAAGHDDDSNLSQPPCERLCDEPAAPTQDDKQQSTPVAGLWLPAPPLAAVQTWDAPPMRFALPPSDPAERAGTPIPIAYLRLAL